MREALRTLCLNSETRYVPSMYFFCKLFTSCWQFLLINGDNITCVDTVLGIILKDQFFPWELRELPCYIDGACYNLRTQEVGRLELYANAQTHSFDKRMIFEPNFVQNQT